MQLSMSRRACLTVATAVAAALVPSVAFAAGGTTSGADIQVSGSASTGSPAPGAVFTYTFQVKNSGPEVATSVAFSDPLPTGTVFNYATANGSTLPCAAIGNLAGGASVSCAVGDIAKGGQAAVVVAVNAPQTASTFTNTGSAAATNVDPNTANNSANVTVQVKAATGGGVNKGGVNDTGNTLSAGPCATIGNLTAPVGYYSVYAAIWNTFSVKSCSANTESVNVEITETNQATGLVDFDYVYPLSLVSTQNLSTVIDNDFAPFNTTYTVTVTASDLSGAVLGTASVVTTTPPPQ